MVPEGLFVDLHVSPFALTCSEPPSVERISPHSEVLAKRMEQCAVVLGTKAVVR